MFQNKQVDNGNKTCDIRGKKSRKIVESKIYRVCLCVQQAFCHWGVKYPNVKGHYVSVKYTKAFVL